MKLVEAGRVRIVAREWWYKNQSRRDSHPWEGAHWNRKVDPDIAAIAEEDADVPLESRRVLIAGDETGEGDAKNLIEHNPSLVRELYDLLNSAEVDKHIPPGVRETVSRFPDEPETLAVRILRDAYNHGDAMEITSPRAPFMLGEKDGAFFSLLQRVLRDKTVPRSQVPQAGLRLQAVSLLPPEELAQLTHDVLRLLETLDGGRSLSLAGFLKSEGHSDLLKWLDQQCVAAATATNGYEAGGALLKIQTDLDNVDLDDSVKDVFANSGTLWSGLSLATAGADVATGATLSTFGWLGIVFGVIPLGHQGLQAMGFLPTNYLGVQWPFLYSFGTTPAMSGATRRRRAALRSALDSLVV